MKNSRIPMAAFLLCMAGGLSACGALSYSLQTEEEVVVYENQEREITLEELESHEEKEMVWNALEYAFDSLDESEQIWYRDIAQALDTMTDRVRLSEEGFRAGLDERAVDKIFQYVLNDHPELFYVEGYSYTKYTRGEKTVAIEFTGTYNADRDTVEKKRGEIEQAAGKIVAAMPEADSDYEKVKYAYETLILQTDYKTEAPENQNIYSVFVGHESVCQGYAKAFQYLMNCMGVECTLVQGHVKDTGEGHAWNLVKADGDYYYVDTTWGDISYQNAEQAEAEDVEENGQPDLTQISYDYLCITTDRILRTHEINEDLVMPECTALEDNYFVREKAYFSEYDKEKLAELIDRRLAEGAEDISFCCGDEACYDEMCKALLDDREIFDYLAGTGINSFVYSNNDKQLTLTFFMVTSAQ